MHEVHEVHVKICLVTLIMKSSEGIACAASFWTIGPDMRLLIDSGVTLKLSFFTICFNQNLDMRAGVVDQFMKATLNSIRKRND